MLKYPSSVGTQQPILAPLESLVSGVPGCELWITFASNVSTNMPDLSVSALKNTAKIARNMSKVFDYLHTNQVQSVMSSQYLLNLSRSAYQVAINANLAAVVSTGTTGVILTVSAQNALSVLDKWDPVQGYHTPTGPGDLATKVMSGVSIE